MHANFGSSLGGISYPMLADFHPKGAMADSMGVYKADRGMTDRATVIVDAKGVVRHASSTGKRDMEALAAICEEIDQAHEDLPALTRPAGLAAGATVYVRDRCAASRAVALARTNLHLEDQLTVKNVSQNPAFLAELKELSGAETAPVLWIAGEVVAESSQIVGHLADRCSAL